MKTFCRFSLLVGLFATVLVLQGGGVQARTPTPTATSTAAPATPTPLPVASFSGEAWVDAHVSNDAVTAKIGGTLCGTAFFMAPPGGGPFYRLEVASEQAIQGCGRDGATITFFVGDRQAPQTAVWHAGQGHGLNLIIGPPFAEFTVSTAGVVPYIGDKACGHGSVVYSNQQEPGCGVEGSTVTFKLVDAQGNVVGVASQTGVWHAWDGISIPQPIRLDFSAGPVTMPGTGTGNAPNAWGELALGLATLGLTSGIGGFALRTRSHGR